MIEERQTAFTEIENITSNAEKGIEVDSIDWLYLEGLGEQLVAYSHSLQGAFPEGSEDGSKAKQAVWDKPEKFNNLMLEMDSGFNEFYQSVEAQNVDNAREGLETAIDTCRSCHRSYRARW
jgi:cytochrome c556